MKRIKVFWIIWAVIITTILILIVVNLLDNDNTMAEFRRGYSAGYEQGKADSDAKWRENVKYRIDSLLQPGIDTFRLLETDTTIVYDTLRGS